MQFYKMFVSNRNLTRKGYLGVMIEESPMSSIMSSQQGLVSLSFPGDLVLGLRWWHSGSRMTLTLMPWPCLYNMQGDFWLLRGRIQHSSWKGTLQLSKTTPSMCLMFRGLKTVSTIRYSLILLMNKVEKPCVGVPEDEDNEFDECQQEHIHHQVRINNHFTETLSLRKKLGSLYSLHRIE